MIGGGSLYKTAALSAGGPAIAEMLGGRIASRQTRDPHEKKLLNVVEEMAIASGTPVPPVYIMDQESAINAFAAGFTPGDAVIGVTRGCMEKLSRDELQGVIAHEFSHIFNGDMRLNLRLIGLIHGIVVISMIGYWLLRITMSGRASRDENKAAAAFALFGLALLIIGSVGAFFGSLIKASISRQREFLADASAVQFTRNPGGIAGALRKIGSDGSKLVAPRAKEASHMYFGSGVSAFFATHPPLKERIERITGAKLEEEFEEREAPAGGLEIYPSQVIAGIGRIDSAHVAHAHSMIGGLSAELESQISDPLGAVATIYGLLAQNDATAAWVVDNAEPDMAAMILKMRDVCASLGAEKRLVIVDLALPALRTLSKSQLEDFRSGLKQLVEADKELSLFEFALERVVAHHLEPGRGVIRYSNMRDIEKDAITILSAVAHMGHFEADRVARGYEAGRAMLGLSAPLAPLAECSFERIDAALGKLAQTAPELKAKIIAALLETAAVDKFVTIEEAEMVRAIADSLDVPIPPFLPGRLAA